MPQIGWLEILAVVIIAILVLGPKEFPIALKKIGSYIGKLKNTFSSFQREISSVTNEAINASKSAYQGMEDGDRHADKVFAALIRRIDAIDKSYQVLANGIGPSHAYVHVVEFNSSVNIHGLNINDGDIIHADQHGAVIIPDQALSIIKKAINHMTKKEKHLIDAAKQENFNIDKLKEAWSKASNEKWEG